MNPKTKIAFNAQHSPIGAFASFTLGFFGQNGGIGLELGGPANENILVGMESRDGESYEALPFFEGSEDESRRYEVGVDNLPDSDIQLQSWAADSLKREFTASEDTWRAGDLKFRVISPFKAVPDPAAASVQDMMAAVVPAVFAEIVADNRAGTRARKVFFGYQGGDPYSAMRRLDDTCHLAGIGQGLRTAIVSDSPGVYSGMAFTVGKCLEPVVPENLSFGLGGVGLLMADIPAGERQTLRFAICFHRAGVVTSGLPASYFYEQYFPDIESVAAYALSHWNEQAEMATVTDSLLDRDGLGEDRFFQLCQAIRSYCGSSQFLRIADQPFWVVNEGEYRMMNTFDLTVDHLFFECDRNPWVVRNQLDFFVQRYSYRDEVRLPDDPTLYPGGISFTHDMGVANHISKPSYSTYELFALDGCFSHMTHEQLVNWILCAVTYSRQTDDRSWILSQLPVLRDCLASLIARDHPDPKLRDGVMSADSSRCLGGSEITTYDSLDTSLGQARNNLYLAVKTWAAYLGLEAVFLAEGDESLAGQSSSQAALCARTIVSHLGPDGCIPAIMGEGNKSMIIPAIEGLVFPSVWGMTEQLDPSGRFADLLAALRTHLETILVPGVCIFPDGGWKLSSTNDNSWLSKIYICQFVAERVFGIRPLPAADLAHRNWLIDPRNAYFAWSDQMVSGLAQGSKYYPRGVTAWLWRDIV